MTIRFNDEMDERKLRRLAQALPGAFYAGPIHLFSGTKQQKWHVISIVDDKGRRQAVYCKSQEMAEAIAATAQEAERRSGVIHKEEGRSP